MTEVHLTLQARNETHVRAFGPLEKGATGAHTFALASGSTVDFRAVLARKRSFHDHSMRSEKQLELRYADAIATTLGTYQDLGIEERLPRSFRF